MADSCAATIIQWTSDYAVGDRQIDEEHRQLLTLAQALHQAMLEGKGKAILLDLLTSMADYSSYHFAHEERLMERIGYPGYRQHLQQHRDLRSRLRAMQCRAATGERTMTIEVMLFLTDWLKGHIAASDRRIAQYIETSGRSVVP